MDTATDAASAKRRQLSMHFDGKAKPPSHKGALLRPDRSLERNLLLSDALLQLWRYRLHCLHLAYLYCFHTHCFKWAGIRCNAVSGPTLRAE